MHAQGLIHAGGVLADATLLKQSSRSVQTVFAPKVGAARLLHGQAWLQPSKTQLFFSSVAAMLGSAGQASYSTANAALDGLAACWKLQGCAGIMALQWGAWAGGGMAASLTEQHMERLGMALLNPQQGLNALQLLLTHAGTFPNGGIPLDALPQDATAQDLFLQHTMLPVAIMPICASVCTWRGLSRVFCASVLLCSTGPACVAAVPFKWPRFLARLSAPSPFFQEFAPSKVSEHTDMQLPLRKEAPLAIRSAHMLTLVQHAISVVLGRPAEASQPLMAAGRAA